MKFVLEERKAETLRSSAVSVPNSLYTTKIFGKDIEIDTLYNKSNENNPFIDLWNNQHPLMHTWLVLSSISIFFLSAIFFIVK